MKIKLEFEVPMLDFITTRLTSGKMDWPTSQTVSAVLNLIQQQANDPKLNPKTLNVVEAVRAAQEGKTA